MVDDTRRRRLAGALVLAGAAMLPWLFVLDRWLPATTTISGWSRAWIGLDGAEGVGLLLTGLLLLRGDRRIAVSAAFTSALLCADAWFDTSTAAGGALAIAVAMATLVELPVAALCAWLSFGAVASPAGRSARWPT